MKRQEYKTLKIILKPIIFNCNMIIILQTFVLAIFLRL